MTITPMPVLPQFQPKRAPRLHVPAGAIALLLAALAACGADAQGGNTNPIRVLRVGHGDVSGMKNSIDVSHAACLAFQHLPPTPTPMPSEAELARLVVIEEEELFASALWAKFVVQRQIAADPARNCQLSVFASRNATVERTCDTRTVGSTLPMSKLVSPEPSTSLQPQVREEQVGGEGTECGRAVSAARRRSDDLSGLPVVSAGPAQCVWSSAILARGMNAAGIRTTVPTPDASPDEMGSDTCVYEKHPHYYANGVGRVVVLQSKASDRSLSGDSISAIFGETAAFGNLRLAEFSDGTPIASSRFTRAAVEAFVRQPVKTPVGDH